MNTRKLPDYQPATRGTLAAFCAAFIDGKRAERKEASTIRRYDTAFRQLLSVPVPGERGVLPFGQYRVTALTQGLINLAIGICAERFGAKATNYAKTIASSAMVYAIRCEEYAGRNPFAYAPHVKATEATRRVSWEPEEIRAVYEAAAELGRPVVTAAMRLAELTAQRPVDVVSLRGRDYNAQTGILTLKIRKTDAELRVSLESQPELRRAFAGLGPDQPWLVDGEVGPVTDPEHFRPIFRKVREAAGVRSELRFSDLRRTKLTALGDAGVTRDRILAVSQHRNPKHLNSYINRTQAQAKHSVDVLADLSQAPAE